MLIAFFNINLFSYYQLGPFIFEQLMLNQQQFGLTGILLAFGVGMGSLINHYLLAKKQPPEKLVKLASGLSLVSGCLVYLLHDSVWFVFPVMGIVIGYGIAIPNILAHALNHYQDRKGTAGTILGLFLLYGISTWINGRRRGSKPRISAHHVKPNTAPYCTKIPNLTYFFHQAQREYFLSRNYFRLRSYFLRISSHN